MAKKWYKGGALKKISPAKGLHIATSKIIGKLNSWDLLPMGEKIRKIRELTAALHKPPAGGEYRFLSLAPRDELQEISRILRSRLIAENTNLRDMKSVFSHWQVDLSRIGVTPEKISYPHGTNWLAAGKERLHTPLHPAHGLYYFSSPVMASWYEKNVLKKDLIPSRLPPAPQLIELIHSKKAFGLARMPIEKGSARIELVQPLVFYRKDIRSRLVRGKEGTARTLPLENPDLLILYAQLKEAKLGDAKVVRVHSGVPSKKLPFDRIYDRIGKLSHPLDFMEDRGARAVFRPRARK